MNIIYMLYNLGIKLLPPPICNTLRINKFLKYHYNTEMWGGGIFQENVNRALKLNLSEDELKNTNYVNSLKRDLVRCYLIHEATPEEYFVFNFKNKNESQRDSYLTNMTKDKILIDRIGWKLINRLRDKYQLYQLLPDLFKRDICIIKEPTDCILFNEFIKKHSSFFVKPLNGMCGRGTSVLKGDCFNELLTNGEWIIEEIVKQDDIMASFNNSSVNTIRLPSFYKNGQFIPIAPFFRTGRKGSIVDNGAAGGIFAAIDEKTGIIISDGYDEDNRTYQNHPDSGIKFRGFQIPQWNELLNTAKLAHKKLSDQRYIAWDFALTSKGWVLIEANSMGQFLWQYATKIGLKDRFIELIN